MHPMLQESMDEAMAQAQIEYDQRMSNERIIENRRQRAYGEEKRPDVSVMGLGMGGSAQNRPTSDVVSF